MTYIVEPTKNEIGGNVSPCERDKAHQFSVYKELEGIKEWVADFAKESDAYEYISIKNKCNHE